MSVRNVTRTLPFVLILVLTRHVLAITSFDKEFVCPICKTKNVFRVYASWGSYVYQWPSKFQLVFGRTRTENRSTAARSAISLPFWRNSRTCRKTSSWTCETVSAASI